jgi:cell division septal protein FtsQ
MRPETKQLLKNISFGLGVFLLIGLILYGVWHGTRAERLTISEVIVSGGETISHSAVANDISGLLEGEYLGFIPKRFAWTYPEQEILATLGEIDRAKDPQISRDGTTLNIALSEYKPVALWCDDYVASRCVFLNTAGYGFALAPELTGGAFIRYGLIGKPAALAETFTQPDDFGLLRELVSLLNQAGWRVASVELDQARDVYVYLAAGGELKLSLLLTPDVSIDNLQTVLTTEQYKHLVPGNFVYIDLRFGNKVFVSEFGAPIVEEVIEESIEIETATSSSEAAVE